MSTQPQSPIFADPSGRRARRSAQISILALLFLLLMGVGFLISVLIPPRLPNIVRARRLRPANLPVPRKEDAAFATQMERPIGRPRLPAKGPRVVAGYLPTWNPMAVKSLEAHARSLNTCFPTFFRLTPDATIAPEPSTTHDVARNITQICKSANISLEPTIANAVEGEFLPEAVRTMLQTPAKANALRDELVARAEKNGWGGIQIDFEGMNTADSLRLAAWMKGLKAALGPKRRLSIAVQPRSDPVALAALGAAADLVVCMAYDEHEETGSAGPIASFGFVRDSVLRVAKVVPPDKLVLGIGVYAYDWKRNRSSEKERAVSLTHEEAITTAAGYRDTDPPYEVMDFDDRSRNPHFEYDDDDDVRHDVWILDAATAYNSVKLTAPLGLRGVAIWALGGEDPGVWDAVTPADPKPSVLTASRVTATIGELQFTGTGEILRIEKEGSKGARRFSFDENGFVDDMIVDAFPTGMLVRRYGGKPKAVALTFDDGPDPTWTPKILEELARLKVPGTFFVIGEQTVREPEIVARTVEEGHDVGSHSFSHPNLGVVANERVNIELDATQRAIQAATGRSTTLFRPPFNADSTPTTTVEMRPVIIASKKGYLTIGESVDPDDWLITPRDGRERTGRQIAEETIAKVKKAGPGAAILLHDGGGDRSRTVEALSLVVAELQKEGYRFVTVSDLLGVSRDKVMPPLVGRQRWVALVDRVSFRISTGFERFLTLAFSTAVILGIGRAILVTTLALLHARRRPVSGFNPPVTVIVAAYNEERVIERTVRSLLASSHPVSEIIVVDDGSTDATAEVVQSAFAGEPRVRLLTKPNGGKASALNLALASTEAEIVVGVDADTQLPADAIGLLIAPLADPEIGMTAGNVQVGNVRSAVTQWQDIEYTTSQNLDRRAYALLNCITVVPGAIGAWRRDAVLAAGGYDNDTLAEDMDLTWRMRRAGWRAETVPEALAFTEAPETVRAFLRQRFRWTFGTLQCLFKHRSALGRYGWFGGFALPALWIFQIGVQVIAPFVDLQVAWSLITAVYTFINPVRAVNAANSPEWDPRIQAMHSLTLVLLSAGFFLLVELLSGVIAYRMDRRSPRPLLWLPLQRLVYRQIMYIVVWRSLVAAIKGARHGWGKLERTARIPETA